MVRCLPLSMIASQVLLVALTLTGGRLGIAEAAKNASKLAPPSVPSWDKAKRLSKHAPATNISSLFQSMSSASLLPPSTQHSHSDNHTAQQRRMQSTDLDAVDNFEVSYVGLFLAVQSAGCTSPSPVLRAFCNTNGTLTLNTTRTYSSDDVNEIECTPIVDPDAPDWDGLECVVSENSTDTSWYVNSGPLGPGLTGWGEVFFNCSGPTLDSVVAIFSWQDTGDGSCTNTDSDGDSEPANFHLARLGIECSPQKFEFDDHFVEGTFAVPLDSQPDSFVTSYTSVSGLPCSEPTAADTCAVTFDTLFLFSQPYNFRSPCLTKAPGTAIPSEPPVPEPNPALNVTARFRASWAESIFDTETGNLFTATSSNCTSPENRTINVMCDSPGTTITWIEDESSTSIACKLLEGSIYHGGYMDCIDSSGLVDTFQNIVYECSGGLIPTTKVEYPTHGIVCNGNNVDVTVRTSLQLVPYCRATPGKYMASDLYVECGDYTGFDYVDSTVTCSSVAEIPSMSPYSHFVSFIVMSTDTFWNGGSSAIFDEMCLTIVELGDAVLPVSTLPLFDVLLFEETNQTTSATETLAPTLINENPNGNIANNSTMIPLNDTASGDTVAPNGTTASTASPRVLPTMLPSLVPIPNTADKSAMDSSMAPAATTTSTMAPFPTSIGGSDSGPNEASSSSQWVQELHHFITFFAVTSWFVAG